ncbi:MAG TPA: hypothetical protein VLL52_19840 [Anaerolineae bacterium]|nr:hypothetical protein [Anaerolineae bacterium]
MEQERLANLKIMISGIISGLLFFASLMMYLIGLEAQLELIDVFANLNLHSKQILSLAIICMWIATFFIMYSTKYITQKLVNAGTGICQPL